MSDLAALIERLRDGDTAALARAITLAETSSQLAAELHARIRGTTEGAQLIGVTGAPGVGKSTLLNAMISAWREQGSRVAVIAVDPSSPITGGAVLGDRTRMGQHGEDAGVFIRSVAARGHLGGLSADILCIIDLIDTAGWDVILLETVGTGQSETEVAEIADINLVINSPGLGDDVQAIKAGILEIADILVINKADSPLASRTERELKAMLQLREVDSRNVPVIKTVATEGKGIEELLEVIATMLAAKWRGDSEARFEQRSRRLLAEKISQQVKSMVLEGADLSVVNTILKQLGELHSDHVGYEADRRTPSN